MLLTTPKAVAFGTITFLWQNAEHSRITRRALSCAETNGAEYCFDKNTLESLAGNGRTFGAIGASDRGARAFVAAAHCSAGDYLDTPDYPRTKEQAQRALTKCRDNMLENMERALKDAEKLLDESGNLRRSQIPGFFGCVYLGDVPGRAKCNVLGRLGQVLHNSQDFYAHTNWVDVADVDEPISRKNPPGLGRTGMAPWLDLRIDNPEFPEGLISGCGDVDSRFGEDGGCKGRVLHRHLHKDTGQIDPEIGRGTSRRGAVNDNFKHAVEAAIEDTSDKWLTFQEALVGAYGEERGRKMACIIAKDRPGRDCV
jgi:hypothetical protein